MPLPSFDQMPNEGPPPAALPNFDAMTDESQPHSYLGDIAHAFTSAASTVNANLNPFSQAYKDAEKQRAQSSNPLESMISVGRGALAIPQMVVGPVMKAIAPAVAEPMTSAEKTVGEFLARRLSSNPTLPTREQVYQATEPDVETALGLVTPGKVKPTLAPPPPASGPFGVTLSEGQATGDLSAIQREQAALRGQSGQGPQEAAQTFADQQRAQAQTANERIAQSFDPFGQTLAETPQEAGALLSRGVQTTATQAKADVKASYKLAQSLPGEIHAGVFEGMGQGIKGDLTLGDNPVIIDDRTTPNASKMIDYLDNNIKRLNIQNKADPFGPPNPENITGVNLQGVDQMRKNLSAIRSDAYGSSPPGQVNADARATQAVLNSFDARIDDAVNNGMFTGNKSAIAAWNNARAANADYQSAFGVRKGDPVSRVVQKIIGNNVNDPLTAGKVMDQVTGSAVNPTTLNIGVANRLKTILGEQSPEWISAKQGLFQKLVQPGEGEAVMGPGKVAQRVSKFLNSDMADVMYAPHEQQVLRSYSDLMRKLEVPQAGANWSNTGAAKVFRAVSGRLGLVVGMMLGRTAIPIPIVGEAAGMAGAETVGKLHQMREAAQIARQMPIVADQMRRWQKAVQAAQNPRPSRLGLAAATNSLANALAPLGIDLAQITQGTGAAYGQPQQ